ncbi:MAG: argininosuccinate lyase [Candidatus Omnitrophota bacterium]|jgi:argininosuccinate lyase
MKALWGGRFRKTMHPALQQFSYSLACDRLLFGAEIRVNRAYTKMLARGGWMSRAEAARVLRGLSALEASWDSEKISALAGTCEDIHSFIQGELEKKAGPAAKKIHTGRSRNDLVVTSTRLYLKDKVAATCAALSQVQSALVFLAAKAGKLIIPGMTHLRKAQPVLMAHHLLAYVEMLEEDRGRLLDALKRIDVLVLGSAALAGSSLPLDRKFLARELGFRTIAANSMAATSDRGFMAEIAACLSILWMHLSRMAEDFILWNSEPFNLIELDDAFATGSSLMPQKKNPDIFELIRGRSGTVFGVLVALLTVQKGLALCYNRDLQEDKPGLFEALSKTDLALGLLPHVLRSISFKPASAEALLADDTLFATDLLELLVRRGVSFSDAHTAIGKLVAYGLEKKKPLRSLALAEFRMFSSMFDAQVYGLFDPHASVTAKKTVGSTNPAMVRAQIGKWEKELKKRGQR